MPTIIINTDSSHTYTHTHTHTHKHTHNHTHTHTHQYIVRFLRSLGMEKNNFREGGDIQGSKGIRQWAIN